MRPKASRELASGNNIELSWYNEHQPRKLNIMLYSKHMLQSELRVVRGM